MPPKEKYSDPKLRDEVKEEIKEGDKGGEPGQWSARKAQMMAKEYKARGGDYNTPKSSKDDSQKNLDKWNEEDWQTKEGSGEARQSNGSRKRYLPKKAWEQMDEKEKRETDEKKQKEGEEGKQFVGNTKSAKKARKDVTEGSKKNKGEDETGVDTRRSQSQEKSPSRTRSQRRGQQDGEQTDKDHNKEAANDNSSTADEKESRSPSHGQKRSRKQDDGGEVTNDQKKQKTSSSASKPKSGDTIGSKHDKATPPARQGSTSRLPKKGQKNVHWKAMPGWVEGEVVEVVHKDKDIEGKNVKASKNDPKVVLKSKSSGKICVHKADNVYFD